MQIKLNSTLVCRMKCTTNILRILTDTSISRRQRKTIRTSGITLITTLCLTLHGTATGTSALGVTLYNKNIQLTNEIITCGSLASLNLLLFLIFLQNKQTTLQANLWTNQCEIKDKVKHETINITSTYIPFLVNIGDMEFSAYDQNPLTQDHFLSLSKMSSRRNPAFDTSLSTRRLQPTTISHHR